MAKKKTLIVETKKNGRAWTISVSGSGEDVFSFMAAAINGVAGENDCVLLNSSDPFMLSRRRKKVVELK